MFRRLQWLARWHRRIALLVAIWLVALAITGLLINHAHDFGLDSSRLPAPLQRLAYGIEVADTDFCGLRADIGPGCAVVFGRLSLPAGDLLLAPESLYLFDQAGRLIESLPVSQVGLIRLTGGLVGADGVLLRDRDRIVRADFDLLEWRALDGEVEPVAAAASWQTDSGAPDPITWERFLLDLHAARFLGPVASAFTDAMALLILLLAASGVWFWWLKRKRA
jgi:hypothetical protein